MSDIDATERPQESATQPSGSRREQPWLNAATIRGGVMLAAGAAILLAPDLSTLLIRVIVGMGLLAVGVADLWFRARGEPDTRLSGVAEAILAIIAGVALLAWPGMTLKTLVLVAVAYVAVRGVVVLVAAFRERDRGRHWRWDASRGLLLIVLAAIALFIPQAIIHEVIAAAAVAAMIAGAIVVSYGRSHSADELVDVDTASLWAIIFGWIDSNDVGDDRREEIGDGLFFEEPGRGGKLMGWWVLLLLSVAIATFGVMQDSTAVVIGAMLVAPLMTPILGTAAGIVNAWIGRIGASLILVAAGVAAAIALAFAIGQWFPMVVPIESNSQVLSRISPNLIDMMIAIAAGAAGAYANVDRRVSGSIAGVAIAVALVPPLGVVGLNLQATFYNDAVGAFLLFLTNFVSIILAASGVFFLMGYAPIKRLRENRAEVGAVLRTVALAALVIMVPLVLTVEGVMSSSGRQHSAQTAVSEWLGDDSDLRTLQVEVDGTEVNVFVSGPGEVPAIQQLENAISEAFGTRATVLVEHAATSVITATNDT